MIYKSEMTIAILLIDYICVCVFKCPVYMFNNIRKVVSLDRVGSI